MRATLLLLAVAALRLGAQSPCSTGPIYSPCEIVFELSAEDLKANPNPYATVNVDVEFRSPRHRTFLMPGFYDSGNRMIVRFTPVDVGKWDYRVSSNISRWEGKLGQFEATASDTPGFIMPRNVHHWSYTENNVPHLWMGDTNYRFATLDRPVFETIINTRAEQKFNHLRGMVIPMGEEGKKAVPDPDRPNADFFRELDSRVAYLNSKGIIADLVLAGDQNQLADLFPTWQQRDRFIRYLAGRYAPFNITWQGVQEFEEYKQGRTLLKEIGELLKKYDAYGHPRSTHTVATSSPLLPDGWMNYVTYQSSDDQLGAIEHQLYPVPFVNAEFAYENSGAGATHAHHVDSDTFRHRLWNATMDGQYPTFGNTGAYGGAKIPVDTKYLDSPGAKAMKAWFEFFSGTRHWELEPYFDVDGARAIALPGVEYIVYVEKAGPVEVLVEKHGYDIAWVSPITGERLPQKNWKGERWTGEPPTKDQDWVLHISREGRKEGMRSYKFESRPILMQVVEQNATRVPYAIAAPEGDAIPFDTPAKYEAKLKRETHATRSMMYVWTGEVPGSEGGFRVIGTGETGTFKFGPGFLKPDSVLTVRLAGMNAVGKVYFLDRVYQVGK